MASDGKLAATQFLTAHPADGGLKRRRSDPAHARARRRARSHPEADRRAEAAEGHARPGALRPGDGEAADRAGAQDQSDPRPAGRKGPRSDEATPQSAQSATCDLALAAIVASSLAPRTRSAAAAAAAERLFGGFRARRRRQRADPPERAVRRPFTFVRLRYGPATALHDAARPLVARLPRGRTALHEDPERADLSARRTPRRRTSSRSTTRSSFKYPVAYLCEPGGWDMTDHEAATFRDVPAEGRLPDRRRLPLPALGQLRGADAPHPARGAVRRPRRVAPDLPDSFFEIKDLANDPADTTTRACRSSAAIYENNDPKKRLMAIINYNTDISEYWEWSDTGLKPIDESNEAYKTRRQLHHLRDDTLNGTNTVDLESTDDVALADRMNAGPQADPRPSCTSAIIGQGDVIELVLLSLFVGGNSLIVGVPGLAKTLLIATLAKVVDLKFNRIQFTPDLMPSDITGTDIIQEDPATGRRQMVFAPGPDLREHRAGRRNQPHAAQDAVGAARGDAGAPRHDSGPHLRPRRAVLRLRDAEPDRARRHVSAARSAARPLHVPHRHRASAGRRGVRRRAHDDGDRRSALRAAGDRRRSGRVPAAGPPRAGRRPRAALRAVARPHEPAEVEGRARIGEEMGGVRRQRPRGAVSSCSARRRAR